MWLAKQAALSDRERQGAVTTGEVTISGGSPGAKADGELRGLELAAPEGVYWKPRAGQQMLLLHADDGSELAAGVLGQAAPADLAPGELLLTSAGGAVLRLKNDGSIRITGALYINGMPYVPGGGGA